MKTYYPDYVEKARKIAMRVPYTFRLVYDMVMMGLTADEIERLCQACAAMQMPECDAYKVLIPGDMHDLAGSYSEIKSKAAMENLERVFNSITKDRRKQKEVLSNRDRHNYRLQHSRTWEH